MSTVVDFAGETSLMSHHSTARNATKSPLLRLPAELRNLIYACTFDNTTYNFFQDNKPTEKTLCAGSSTENNMSLLLVSRQVHAETAYLPYELSTFDFLVYKADKREWKAYLRRFLAKRSEEQIKAMSCLTLRRWSYEEQTFAMGTGLYWVKRLKIKKY